MPQHGRASRTSGDVKAAGCKKSHILGPHLQAPRLGTCTTRKQVVARVGENGEFQLSNVHAVSFWGVMKMFSN